MYLGFYSFYKNYNRNRMFTDPSSAIGDDLMYPLVYLGRRLAELGHKVATLDTDDLEKFDAAIFLDHPTFLNPYFRRLRQTGKKKLYLFLFENAANRPDNYWIRNHREFEKVFTWDSELIDQKKYFRFFLPNRIPSNFQLRSGEKTKFCVAIASQKYSGNRHELYSERVRSIRWFEQEHPSELDLFGTTWDRRWFTGKLSRLNLFLQKFYAKFPNSLVSNQFPSYRGRVKSKNAVMRQYKFALTYENAIFPGYITEKIFDALFAGCVPIYAGASDVTNFIPAQVFIDKRNFRNYADLYHYLKTMSEAEYQGYLSAIHSYVSGERIYPFSAEFFTETIISEIIQERHPCE